ncbi:MAG: DegV family protein [Clostridiales bacterium]|jgi:DegV family protein with EDD domain|nr:DegV family protein [Clostridiales bacterium]
MEAKKIALLTDSACDLSEELLKRYQISVIPLRLIFSGSAYRDRVELPAADLYPMLEQEIPSTSLPSGGDIAEALEQVKQSGADQALFVGMSSGLSGTYHFVKSLGEERTDLRVHAVDSRTLSCGQSSLVLTAARVLEASGNIQQAVRAMEEVRARMRCLFVVRNLSYLRRGGRIGKVEGTVGALLRINPLIEVNQEGVYETAAKTVGFQRAIGLLVKEIKRQFSGKRIVVSAVHGLEEETALTVIDQIKSFADVAECSLTPVSAALGAHTGPGLVGIAAYELL